MEGKSLNVVEEKLEQLKALLPEAFSEGKIDWEKLRLTLGDDVNISDERYVLNWAGKTDAYRVLQTPTTTTLAPDRGQSVNFEETDNIFIEGENLEVLKVLQKAYYGKVKMIYIDPPYNTGNDSFVYPDRFSESREEYLKRVNEKDEEGMMMREGIFRKNSRDSGHYHSNWLSMMYPRLFLARNLLKNDGVIFVNIDDNEVHNLRLLMNEVFGEENFIASVIWQHSIQGKNDVKGISQHHNYLLVYSKSSSFIVGKLERTEEHNKAYSNPDDDPKGLWRSGDVRSPNYRENLRYDIENPSGKIISPPKNGWRWTKKKVDEKTNSREIVFSDDETRIIRKIYLADQEGRVTESIWFGKDVGTTRSASQELKDLFEGETPFDTPKPTTLIRRMLQIATDGNGQETVLDFFGGSASTAQAVIETNLDDEGQRRFIIIQIPEKMENGSYNSIADVAKERIRRSIDKVQSENPMFAEIDQDIGFRVFKLKQSNFKLWRGDGIKNKEDIEQQLELLSDPVRPEALEENILFELLLKSGYPLTTKVEKRDVGKEYYYLVDSELAIALSHLDDDIIQDMLEAAPQQAICLDSLFTDNDPLKTNTQLQFKDAGIAFHSI